MDRAPFALLFRMDRASFAILFLLSAVFLGGQSTTFTLVNKCAYTIWPGILTGAGTNPPLSNTGFSLASGATTSISPPAHWSGRIWARTYCSTDPSTGKFSCQTGDCGSGTVECSGNGAAPPATLAEFTLNGSGGLDFYDVSLVDGFNIPLVVLPIGEGNCSAAGCYVDLNGSCPSGLKVVIDSDDAIVACRSACEAFRDPSYCCSGAYATPESCKPSNYSKYFKSACPTAYSYAYDDATSTFTCAGADYVITFCPALAAISKTSGQEHQSIAPDTSPASVSLNNAATAISAMLLCCIFVFVTSTLLMRWS